MAEAEPGMPTRTEAMKAPDTPTYIELDCEQGIPVALDGMKMSAKWVREHLSYTSDDYAGMLKGFGKPVLAVTGTADLSADFRSLDSIKDVPTVTCYAPEGVNHILREIDDDNSVTKVKKQYLRLSARPIHPGTKDVMAGWLSRFLGR